VRSLRTVLRGEEVRTLREQTVTLLVDMHYCSSQNEGKSIARRFMEYEPVLDVILLASDRSRPMPARLNCAMLLAKIIVDDPSQRKRILHDGAACMLVELGRDLTNGETISDVNLCIYLEVCLVFAKAHRSATNVSSYMSMVS
jgi:hypothetical protein